MSTSPITLNSASGASATSSSTSASAATPTEADFLQLLVAQLKYQDPSQPTDGTAFVSELAQFTDVSNTTDMSSDLDTIVQLMQASASTSTAPPASSTQPGSSSSTANQVSNS